MNQYLKNYIEEAFGSVENLKKFDNYEITKTSVYLCDGDTETILFVDDDENGDFCIYEKHKGVDKSCFWTNLEIVG